MATASRTKPYHHGDLRRALLDATLVMAEERGAGGVTLREVAREAGVSQTAPYRHFADKQQMLAAASEEGFVLLRTAMQAAIGGASEAADEQLLVLGTTYVRFALDHAAHFHLMFGHGSPPKSATPALQEAARSVFQLFLGTAARSLGKRPHERAVKQIVFRLWSMAHGIAALALEKQVLFDAGGQVLMGEAREAMASLLAAAGAERRRPQRTA